jgi:hypothetical protein
MIAPKCGPLGRRQLLGNHGAGDSCGTAEQPGGKIFVTICLFAPQGNELPLLSRAGKAARASSIGVFASAIHVRGLRKIQDNFLAKGWGIDWKWCIASSSLLSFLRNLSLRNPTQIEGAS